jgi:hypothetical protein
MREQGASGLGLTVSHRFSTKQEADDAAKQLRSAGFREEDIRIWQHKKRSLSSEDRLARTFEGFLAGGFIGGLISFFTTVASTWSENQDIADETTVGITVLGAVVSAVVVALIVNIVSTKFAFSHPHHVEPDEPPSVVTVRAGDKEDDARKVFDTAATAGH